MKVVIAGGSGFIGTSLARALSAKGEVVVLSRQPGKVEFGRGVRWDGVTVGDWKRELADADAIINLAGAGIAEKRWSEERKAILLKSRLEPTAALVRALGELNRPRNPLFLSASAIGVYGDRGEETVDEGSRPGNDFLAGLALRWENAALEARSLARVAIMRLGIVLAKDGGALREMLTPFRLYAGGRFGSGQQWMSWIDRTDVLSAIEFILESADEGCWNLTAPQPRRNREFVQSLGRVLGRPALLAAPAVALRVAFGEMAGPLLLASQKVVPQRLLAAGFEFRYPALEGSLERAFTKILSSDTTICTSPGSRL